VRNFDPSLNLTGPEVLQHPRTVATGATNAPYIHGVSTPLVFVYGTLKRGFANHHRLGLDNPNRATYISKGVTDPYDGYTMIPNQGYPYVVRDGMPGTLATVRGEIFKVHHEGVIEDLDCLEGIDYDHYSRVVVRVYNPTLAGLKDAAELGYGNPVACHMYVAPISTALGVSYRGASWGTNRTTTTTTSYRNA